MLVYFDLSMLYNLFNLKLFVIYEIICMKKKMIVWKFDILQRIHRKTIAENTHD
jgi:hypothetical protein